MYYLRVISAYSWYEPKYGDYSDYEEAKAEAEKIAKGGFWDEASQTWFTPLFLKRITVVDREEEEEEKRARIDAKRTKIIRKKRPWYRRWLSGRWS